MGRIVRGGTVDCVPAGSTGVCTRRAFAARLTHATRMVKPNQPSRAGRNGRTWDRNGLSDDRLGLTWGDFSPLLQGLLVDADGRPVSLSATGFHSVLGQIW